MLWDIMALICHRYLWSMGCFETLFRAVSCCYVKLRNNIFASMEVLLDIKQGLNDNIHGFLRPYGCIYVEKHIAGNLRLLLIDL